jgi:hypothetical protein
LAAASLRSVKKPTRLTIHVGPIRAARRFGAKTTHPDPKYRVTLARMVPSFRISAYPVFLRFISKIKA